MHRGAFARQLLLWLSIRRPHGLCTLITGTRGQWDTAMPRHMHSISINTCHPHDTGMSGQVHLQSFTCTRFFSNPGSMPTMPLPGDGLRVGWGGGLAPAGGCVDGTGNADRADASVAFVTVPLGGAGASPGAEPAGKEISPQHKQGSNRLKLHDIKTPLGPSVGVIGCSILLLAASTASQGSDDLNCSCTAASSHSSLAVLTCAPLLVPPS